MFSWFRFEKYIGGKYMGSILSLSLATLARAGLFPASPLHDALQTVDISLFEELVNICSSITNTPRKVWSCSVAFVL